MTVRLPPSASPQRTLGVELSSRSGISVRRVPLAPLPAVQQAARAVWRDAREILSGLSSAFESLLSGMRPGARSPGARSASPPAQLQGPLGIARMGAC